MTNWLYRRDGKDCGPVSERAILLLLEQELITSEDLICREGENDWVPLRTVLEFDRRGEHSDESLHHFVELPQLKSEKSALDIQKDWVLLQKKGEPSETRFIQSGPFSIDEILNKIHIGEADFNDYAWKRGMHHWQRIGAMTEFDRRQDALESDAEPDLAETKTFPDLVSQSIRLGVTASRRIWQSVLHQPNAQASDQNVDRPPEAEGPDLTTVPVSMDIMPPAPPEIEELANTSSMVLSDDSEMVELHGPVGEETQKRKKQPRKTKDRRRRRRTKGVKPRRRQEKLQAIRRTQQLALLTMLTAVGALGWVIYNHLQKEVVETPPSPARVSPPPATPARKIVSRKTKPEDNRQDWLDEPRLALIPAGMDSENSKLIIKTNAAIGQPVRVTVTGESGQIVGPLSFRRRVTLKKKKDDEDINLYFKHLGAPLGSLKIQVSAGSTQATSTIFHGRNDRSFSYRLAQQLKQFSFQFQKERKQLFYLTKNQLRHLKQLDQEASSRGQGSFYKRWSSQVRRNTSASFEAFSLSDWRKFALPDKWVALKRFRKEMLSLGDQLSRNSQNRQNPGFREKINALESNLKSLQADLSEMSIFKDN